MIKKIAKISVLLLLMAGTIFYFSSTKLFKNKLKHLVFHKLDIIDADWVINTIKKDKKYTVSLDSPTLLIDDIYTSMEGPYVYKKLELNENQDELYWVHGFKIDAKSKMYEDKTSDDFICHANLYHSNVEHFARMGLDNRIGAMGESQLITLTQGHLDVLFPEGFGYPVFSNEKIIIGAQALNLNKKKSWFKIDYNLKLEYSKKEDNKIKPLYMQYVVLALPYEEELVQEFKLSDELKLSKKLPDYVKCAGPESNTRHEAYNEKGEKITAFWEVPVGKHIYTNNVTRILKLSKTEIIHYINIHVHPYAESLELIDVTTNTSVFKSIITNFKDRKGIKNFTYYSSKLGLKLFSDHQYEMKLTVNNTTNKEIDMMASMFFYFYDKELAEKLKE